jgi:hypothetical protein
LKKENLIKLNLRKLIGREIMSKTTDATHNLEKPEVNDFIFVI